MDYLILITVLIVISIGIAIGVLVVSVIYLTRRRQVIDSLIKIEQIIGSPAIVEVPFDVHSKGKVQVNLNNSRLSLVAFTDDNSSFDKGDRVLIVQVKDNKVLVVKNEFMLDF